MQTPRTTPRGLVKAALRDDDLPMRPRTAAPSLVPPVPPVSKALSASVSASTPSSLTGVSSSAAAGTAVLPASTPAQPLPRQPDTPSSPKPTTAAGGRSSPRQLISRVAETSTGSPPRVRVPRNVAAGAPVAPMPPTPLPPLLSPIAASPALHADVDEGGLRADPGAASPADARVSLEESMLSARSLASPAALSMSAERAALLQSASESISVPVLVPPAQGLSTSAAASATAKPRGVKRKAPKRKAAAEDEEGGEQAAGPRDFPSSQLLKLFKAHCKELRMDDDVQPALRAAVSQFFDQTVEGLSADADQRRTVGRAHMERLLSRQAATAGRSAEALVRATLPREMQEALIAVSKPVQKDDRGTNAARRGDA